MSSIQVLWAKQAFQITNVSKETFARVKAANTGMLTNRKLDSKGELHLGWKSRSRPDPDAAWVTNLWGIAKMVAGWPDNAFEPKALGPKV